jgi:hypothetical protein
LKWWMWVPVAICILLVSSAISGSEAPVPTGPQAVSELGQQAYLRLPSTEDSKQVICLAPDKETHSALQTALMAKDSIGILELTNKGVFCIGNGSKVQVIDRSSGLRRVRIISGVNEVDANKVGRSGWVAMEWVVDR